MKASLFFKIFGLIVALVVVVSVIRGMSGQKMENAMNAIGIEPTKSGLAAAGRPPAEGETALRICPTRVVGFEFGDGPKIEEKKGGGLRLKWMAYDPKEREIDTIAIEKWLSNHCQVLVREVMITGPENCGSVILPRLRLRYVGGASSDLDPRGDRCFGIEGKSYLSPDLAAAIKELRAIAQISDPH